MTTVIDTGITPDTRIVSNVLDYNDVRVNNLDILNQNSVKSIKKHFDELEHPPVLLTELDLIRSKGAALKLDETSISINSIGFFVKLFILIVLLVIAYDFIKLK